MISNLLIKPILLYMSFYKSDPWPSEKYLAQSN